MTQQIIQVGSAAGDGTGDTLRAAMQKINANVTELYGNVTTNTTNITAEVTRAQAKEALLQSKSLRFWLPLNNSQAAAQIATDPMVIVTANSIARAATAATAPVSYDIKKNGTTIGSVAFQASGTLGTITIPVVADRSLVLGDVLEINPPGTSDATLARIAIVLHS